MPAPSNNDPKRQTFLPTPPIGMSLWYYEDDQNLDQPICSFVTKVEGPGKLTLAILRPNHYIVHKGGVHWAGDDRRLQTNRPFRRNGVWDYIPNLPKNKDSTALHKAEIERIENAKRLTEEKIERDRREREQLQERIKKAVLAADEAQE